MMVFIGFDEAVQKWSQWNKTAARRMYTDKYTDCYKKTKEFASEHPDEIPQDYIRQCKLGSLTLLSEAGLMKELFWVLEDCVKKEYEDNAEAYNALIYAVFDGILQEERIDRRTLFYIMSQIDDAGVKQLAERYFRRSADEKSAAGFGYQLAQSFYECFSELKEQYYRIVRAIAVVVGHEADFLRELERRMKKLEDSDADDMRFFGIAPEQHKAYFDFLCEVKAYRAIDSFLDRIWQKPKNGRSPKCLFGEDVHSVKCMLLRIPELAVLNFARKYVQAWEDDYTYEAWVQDIEQHVEEQVKKDSEDYYLWKSIFLWIGVTVAMKKLYQAVVVEKKPGTEYKAELDEVSEAVMYNTEIYDYMTDLCGNLAEVIQAWMLDGSISDAELITHLELLGDKNVFAYDLYDKYTSAYRKFKKIRGLKKDELIGRLRSVTDVKSVIYLFFHTPLWLLLDFYEFLELIHNMESGESMEALLADYDIVGEVRFADSRTSSSGKFQLVPTCLMWGTAPKAAKPIGDGEFSPMNEQKRAILMQEEEVTHGNVSSFDKFMPQIIRDDEGNIKKVTATPCVFQISKLDIDGNVYAWNLRDEDGKEPVVTEEEKTAFCDYLALWMERISSENRVIEWSSVNGDENGENVPLPLKVKDNIPMEKRVEIAGQVAKLVINLAECNEEATDELILRLANPPLENINEFRYIPEQHWTDFSLNEEQEKDFYEYAKTNLLDNERISPRLRVSIYMNTCLRNVLPLEELLAKDDLRDAFYAEKPEWVVPVVLCNYDQQFGTTLFRMKRVADNKLAVVKSNYKFIYNGEYKLRDKSKFVIYCTIPATQPKLWKGEFVIRTLFENSRAVKKHFPWKEYMKCYYDLKKKPKSSLWLNIYERLSELSISFDSSAQVYDALCELHSVIHKQHYNVSVLCDILLLLGEKNVCYDPSETKPYGDVLVHTVFQPENMRAYLLENIKLGYEYLLQYEKYKGKDHDSIRRIGVVYYLSYFRVWKPEAEFIEELAEHIGEDPDDAAKQLMYCKENLNRRIQESQEGWESKKLEHKNARY